MQPNNRSVALSHSELALLYFIEFDKEIASRKLTTWLRNDKQLMEALTRTGYKSGQRYYTPKQVAIIFEHLGTPTPPDIEQ